MKYLLLILALLAVACDEDYKSNYAVVPIDTAGNPYNCYILDNARFNYSDHSVWWVNRTTHQLVEIHGSFVVIRIVNENFDEALKQVKLTKETCNKLHEQMYTPSK